MSKAIPEDHMKAAFSFAALVPWREKQHLMVLGRPIGVYKARGTRQDLLKIWTGSWTLVCMHDHMKGYSSIEFTGDRELYEEDMLYLKMSYL